MRRFISGAFVVLFFTVSVQAAYSPPTGFQRLPQELFGDAFAVAPDGKVALAVGNFLDGNGTVKVFQNLAAAQLGTSPIDTFTDPTFKAFGDVTFADDNTVLFSEDHGANNVFRATIGTGTFSALDSSGTISNSQGVAVSGSTVFVVSANNATTGTITSVPLAGGGATVSPTFGAGFLGGIAVDSSGNLWVTDSDSASSGHGEVLRFTSSFSPIDVANPIILTGGGGAGAFDIVFDHDGDAFVSTDSTLTRIAAGTNAVSQFGSDFGDFSFITGLDFTGGTFQPFNGTGELFVNAGFADDGAIIGIQTPEPSAILLLALPVIMLMFRRTRPAGVLVAALAFTTAARADHFYASQVISKVAGTSQSGQFAVTSKALGGPRGTGDIQGSFDVYNLGNGGSIVLGFDDIGVQRSITDGPGADFIVFENSFYQNGDPTTGLAFAELMFVEVSSDGTNFERFQTQSTNTAAIPGSQPMDITKVRGFAGVHPVYANIDVNPLNPDPFNPAVAGGDAFDLSTVPVDPLVNTAAIRFIRLIDIVGDGNTLDSHGNQIFDPTGTGGAATNGADLDAISVINGVTVPEPAGLLCIGAMAMLMGRTR